MCIRDRRSAVFAPLVVGGQWIGYVGLLFRRRARNFAEEEIESLAGLVGQVAVAAQTILLLEQTRQLLGSEQRQRDVYKRQALVWPPDHPSTTPPAGIE